MSRVNYLGFRNGFPFPIRELAEDGKPFEEWDGSTLCGEVPSKSADTPVTVFGAGSLYGLKLNFSQLVELVWRVKQIKFSLEAAQGEASISVDAGSAGSASITYEFGAFTHVNRTAIEYSNEGDGWVPTDNMIHINTLGMTFEGGKSEASVICNFGYWNTKDADGNVIPPENYFFEPFSEGWDYSQEEESKINGRVYVAAGMNALIEFSPSFSVICVNKTDYWLWFDWMQCSFGAYADYEILGAV